jgi:hypothetical protein
MGQNLRENLTRRIDISKNKDPNLKSGEKIMESLNLDIRSSKKTGDRLQELSNNSNFNLNKTQMLRTKNLSPYNRAKVALPSS